MQDQDRKRWWGRLAFAVTALAAIALVVTVIRSVLADSGAPRRPSIQQIALLRPPPPPPPKPEEKPPEVKKQEVKIPEPQKLPDQAKQLDQPPGKDLGVDAQGGAGSDAFGLVGRPGGQDITTIGGGSGSKFGWYTGLLQQEIQQALSKSKKLREEEYKAIVNIWLKPDGSVERLELVGSSGRTDTDENLKLALMELPPMKEPPSDMPQPVKLRVSNRF